MIKYKKNQVITVPVIDTRQENSRSFFVCGLEDGQTCEVGIFPFQKKEAIPEQIELFVKDVRDGIPVVSQNTVSLFRRFYEVGGCYSFQVEDFIPTYPRPYYRVIDRNGLAVKLSSYGDKVLSRMQFVTCRVLEITESAIEMELVEDVRKSYVEFRPLSCRGAVKGWLELASEMLPEQERLTLPQCCLLRWALLHVSGETIGIVPALEKYTEGEGEWIIELITSLDEHLEEWMTKLVGLHRENSLVESSRFYLALLKSYRKICIYLLEDSAVISGIEDSEVRSRFQDLLSKAEMHARNYESAVSILSEGGEAAARTFADSVIRKMETSGFLLLPEERLPMLQSLFRICPEIMDGIFPRFMNTIISSHARWETGPFHSQVFGLLECYIGYCSRRADAEGVDSGNSNENRLYLLIRALALELLLAGPGDEIDRNYYRAMLYRYASYVESARSEVLTEKAFCCLSRDSYPPLEYGWTIVGMLNPGALAGLLSMPVEAPTSGSRRFHGSMAELRLEDGVMRISTYESELRQRRQLPSDFMPWHGLQILASGKPDPGVRPSREDDLVRCQSWWSYLDRCIFVFKPAVPSVRKEDAEEIIPEDDEIMQQRHLVELIHIIDRYAMLRDNIHDIYNYVSLASLLARIGGENQLKDSYDVRRRLLVALDRFSAGDTSEADTVIRELDSVDLESCADSITRILYHKVHVLTCLGISSRNADLWDRLQESPYRDVRDLCRAVLAYNLLGDGFQEKASRDQLMGRISSMLGIEMSAADAAVIGYESGSLEFKTSIVYPPVKGGVKRIALAEQTHEILRQICGFLNAEGGTLMLGVNDFGIACGLEGDLVHKEFEGSRDRYCRYIRDNIRLEMGSMAESLVTETILDISGHFVLALKIRPSEEPVLLRDNLWQRSGAETLNREGAVKASFIRNRSKVYAQLDDIRKFGTDWRQNINTAVPVSVSCP